MKAVELVLGLAMMAGSAYAVAQPPAPPASPPVSPPQPERGASVSASDLDTFATIYVDLQQLNAEAEAALAEAESEAESQEIQSGLLEKSIDTIEAHGWSVDQYNAVAQSINADPELLERVLEVIEEKS